MGERAPRTRRPWLAPGVAAGLALLVACDEPQAPTGPPRCEPQEELAVERRLKDGFRALAEGDRTAAAAHFDLLLDEEPGHPEALLGQRLAARGGAVVRPAPRAPAAPQGELWLAGRATPIALAVESERWRFEEQRALRELARASAPGGSSPPRDGGYRARVGADGAAVGPQDGARALGVIDLIVLHDTGTATARERFAELAARGPATHFIIDADGTVHQTLDLVWEARHTGIAAVDARSVSIDLVNPVDPTVEGLTPTAREAGLDRPISGRVRVQGREAQAWGYTAPQLESLVTLTRALVRQLPKVTATVPRDLAAGGVEVPRRALGEGASPVGVVGHLHLEAAALDPGPGFPWESFGDALR